jgi:mobilization protein
MIVKFFNTKKGGGNSAIDYLLDKRVKQGTSRILQGDEQLTRDIIKNMNQKHKTCVGVLSFEEKDIDEQLKFKLMADFEKALMTDEAQGRYNILWVEHRDKERLELNFVIPKIDLQTKRALNPYYHATDLSRIASWQDIKNIEHNFENPKDPNKEQTIQGNKKQVEIYKDYEKLDNFLQQEVKNGTLQSRAEIIKLLQDNGVEVTRQGKDYLGIKLPDNTKAKRFKGGIYSDEFRSIESLRAIGNEQKEREENLVKEIIKRNLNDLEISLNEHTTQNLNTINENLRKETDSIKTDIAIIKQELMNLKQTNTKLIISLIILFLAILALSLKLPGVI